LRILPSRAHCRDTSARAGRQAHHSRTAALRTSVAVSAAVAALTALAPAAGAEPTVTLEPASAPAGSIAILKGTGFRQQPTVRVTLRGRSVGSSKAKRPKLRRGRIAQRIRIPSRARGWVRVVTRAGSHSVVSLFRVSRQTSSGEVASAGGLRVRWSPVRTRPGGVVVVRVSGVRRRQRVEIRFAGARRVRRAKRSGSLSVRLTVPAGATGRKAGVRAGGTRLRFTVWVKPPPPPVAPAAGSDLQPTFPIRAAFYYPWFPETWGSHGTTSDTKYHPSLGFYSSASAATIRQHIEAMRFGGMDAGIASWWGQGSTTDKRIPALLSTTTGTSSAFRWSLYYEDESRGDPSAAQISSDLTYIRDRYGSNPSYLRVGGRFVVFVYADDKDACGMVDRWTGANRGIDAYLVLKVFPGYQGCARKPDTWHQYSPAVAKSSERSNWFSVSPGFDKAGESSARLARDPARWRSDVRDMVASGAPWQLVTTFNEWGEGTAVESATEWATVSGYGTYLDVLHELVPLRTSLTPSPAPAPTPSGSGGEAVIAAAGDIACDPASGSFNGGVGSSDSCHQRAVSDLLVGQPLDAVLALGDLQYENGALAKFGQSFDPSWGRVKSLIRPAVGNHEYLTAGASGYFDYFNGVGNQTGPAGDRSKGYYSYDVGAWHIVSINSNCSQAGGCGAGSGQESWLRADLAAHPTACTLAYWHHPLFSSGEHGNNTGTKAIWQALYDANAEIVLSGHDHDYERFAPQTPSGAADPSRGIREFVVGTGGKNHYALTAPKPNSEVRNDDTYGVLKLSLHPNGYEWQFVPEAGKTFTDSGSGSCH